jgi:hypothetical protein
MLSTSTTQSDLSIPVSTPTDDTSRICASLVNRPCCKYLTNLCAASYTHSKEILCMVVLGSGMLAGGQHSVRAEALLELRLALE